MWFGGKSLQRYVCVSKRTVGYKTTFVKKSPCIKELSADAVLLKDIQQTLVYFGYILVYYTAIIQ